MELSEILRPGNFFLTKKFSMRGDKGWFEGTVKGHIIGVMIGCVPAKKPLPKTREDYLRRCVASGVVSFDDVEEGLGKEATDRLMEFLDKKYSEGAKKELVEGM